MLQGPPRARDLRLCFKAGRVGECSDPSMARWICLPMCVKGATCHPLHGGVVLHASHPAQRAAVDVNRQRRIPAPAALSLESQPWLINNCLSFLRTAAAQRCRHFGT